MNRDRLEAEFRNFLTEGKYRKTPERFTILRRAMDMKSHFDVDTLHIALEQDGFHVSRATVYNTVELLEKAGLLRKNLFGQARTALYELSGENHIHVVCRGCGLIQEVVDSKVSAELRSISVPRFKAENFSVTIYGICDKCRDQKTME